MCPMHGDKQGAYQSARQTQTSIVTAPVSSGVGSSPRAPSQQASGHHSVVLNDGLRDPCRAPGGKAGGVAVAWVLH